MGHTLPRMISEAKFPSIKEKALAIEMLATQKGGESWVKFQSDVDAQQAFLDAFTKNFSVKQSLLAAGTEQHVYMRWRSASIYFVTCFNDIVEQWHDDIYTSAARSARGYLVKDEETASGFVEDAEGSPVYHGSNTKLTTMFLKSMYPAEFSDKMDLNMKGSIAINIDKDDADL